MAPYLLRRVLWTIPVLFGVTVITFMLIHFVPGDPARALAGGQASAATVRSIRHQLGLDQPIWTQYGLWLWHILHGEWGNSYRYSVPVLDSIVQRLPATIQLAFAGLACELLIGIPVGLISAVHPHGLVDRLLTVLALLGVSAPTFWLGLVCLYWIAYRWGILPLGGYGGVDHLVLPALTIGLAGGAWYARLLRATMIENLRSDYVRTARAKGLAGHVVVLRHALPNALTPVITQIGLDMGQFLGGVIIVEAVYGWPGVGNWAWQALRNLDVPLVLGCVLVGAMMIVAANLLVDVLYAVIDPRVRLQR